MRYFCFLLSVFMVSLVNADTPKYNDIDQAIARGDLADVTLQITRYPERINQGGHPKLTPLHQAILRKKEDIAIALIKAGADVNQANSNDATPLFIAACIAHESCVALLIHAGADIRKACKNGYTPMKVATDNKREKVATLLKFYERV